MSTTNLLTIGNHSLTGENPYPLNPNGSIMVRHDPQALLRRFPNLTIKDEDFWKEHGIAVENEPPIDNWEIVPVLQGLSQQANKGHPLEITILTIPQGLTRKRIEEVRKMDDLISKCGFIRNLEDTPSQNTYRIVITNIPIEGKLTKDIHVGMPRIIEAIVLMVLGNITDSSVTRCCEQVWGVADSMLASRAVTVQKSNDNKIIIRAHDLTPSTHAWVVYRLKSAEDSSNSGT
ncbi:MAG: hypothetical protein ABSA17_03470 [Rhabdochlamydiaceae bacterium]